MKKVIRRFLGSLPHDTCHVTLQSRIEATPSGWCLFVWVGSAFFRQPGVRGIGYSSLYDTDLDAKTFRYGPVDDKVWLQMSRWGIERDAEREYDRIFRAYTGHTALIHTMRV